MNETLFKMTLNWNYLGEKNFCWHLPSCSFLATCLMFWGKAASRWIIFVIFRKKKPFKHHLDYTLHVFRATWKNKLNQILKVICNLPPFQELNVELWFSTAEYVFRANGIFNEHKRFSLVLGTLDIKMIQKILHVVRSSTNYPYQDIKKTDKSLQTKRKRPLGYFV